MSGGAGYPNSQWGKHPYTLNHDRPSVPPPRPASASSLLPPPYSITSPQAGGNDLARYRSSRAPEQVSPAYRQEANAPRNPPIGSMATPSYSMDYPRRDDRPIIGAPPHETYQDRQGLMLAATSDHRRATSQPYPFYNLNPMQTYTSHKSSGHPTYSKSEQIASPSAVDGNLARPRGPSAQAPFSSREPSGTPTDDSARLSTSNTNSTLSPWGVTKAGKARKRLEQACINCRKKKTKCEPRSSSSKCSPCEKSGSDCNFDTT